MKVKFEVDRMFCKGCAGHVIDAIHAAYPDAEVEVDLETKLVSVSGLDGNSGEIVTLIEQAGYSARQLDEDS